MPPREPEIHLDSPLPPSLPAGARTALFCMGRADRDGDLRLRAGAEPIRAQRSGERFWGVVPCRAAQGAAVEATLGGRVVRLGVIGAAPSEAAPPSGRSIAICLATFDPDPELLRRQIESLRGQTDTDWTCVVSDDHSAPDAFATIEALVEGDARFAVSRSPERIGFYRNFERALRLAPADAELIALCDQDDVWHPGKLARLRAGLGEATLVYSDMRLVDASGRVLRDTLWRGRSNNHTSLASMLVANTVTGAAALMRREVVQRALPFPDSPGIEFHDHWLALVALACGRLAYLDEPLYDYVQHRAAILGKVAGETDRERRVRPRNAYFLGYVPGQVRAEALLERCGDRLSAGQRRALLRFGRADRSALGLLWLLVRPLRGLGGHTETLGAEWDLVPGLIWVRLARRLRLDARFPDPPVFEHRRLRRWRARVS